MDEPVKRGRGKPKGLPKSGGGSRLGKPNKFTAEVKEMILGALSDVGGQQYLARQAEANPVAFMTLVGKVLPMTLAGDPNKPLVFQKIERIVIDCPPN